MYVAEALERQLSAVRSVQVILSQTRSMPPTMERRELDHLVDEPTVLRRATPMYWSKRCTETVLSAASAFDLNEIKAARELVYCDIAFCWFESPWMTLADDKDQPHSVVALSWCWALAAKTGRFRLGVTLWCERQGVIAPVLWKDTEAGDALNSRYHSFFGNAKKDTYWDEAYQALRFVAAAGTFLRQKLLSVEQMPLERHARKRIQAVGWTGEQAVSVVVLRARESRHEGVGTGDNGQVEWTHQWIVRGHVRQQYYPSLGSNLPLWIHPHIKGPEDKPLKPRSTPIISVTR